MGHGVQFHYGDTDAGPCVAFLEGYGWMPQPWKHEPLQGATVYILTPTADAISGRLASMTDALAEVRKAILHFLSHPEKQKHGRVRGKVWAWFNA